MDAWVRNSIMVIVMLIWSVYILVTLLRREQVDTIVWGLPGAVYFALNPTWKRSNEAEKSEKKVGGSA